MKRMSYFFELIIMLVIAAAVHAQDNSIQATLAADRNQLTVGDVIHFWLNVTHPAGYRVVLPEIDQTWGDFDVREVGQPSISVQPDGSQVTTVNIAATLFRTGEHTTPALDLTVYAPNGQPKTLTPEPVTLTVNSVLQEGDTALRDIRGQADMPLPKVGVITPLGIAVGLAGSILAFVALYTFLSRRREKPSIDLRQPHEVAYDELARIQALDLIATSAFTEYYGLLSQCVRQYVRNGLQIPSLERTTAELKIILRESNLPPSVTRDLLAILNECDMVKFGGTMPDAESAQRTTTQIALVIEATRPKPEVAPSPVEENAA